MEINKKKQKEKERRKEEKKTKQIADRKQKSMLYTISFNLL
jgi:hypothetical protein